MPAVCSWSAPTPPGMAVLWPVTRTSEPWSSLVEAGFTPEQAIQIATSNGARYLGIDEQLGTVEVGKIADLVVVRGDVSADISSVGGHCLGVQGRPGLRLQGPLRVGQGDGGTEVAASCQLPAAGWQPCTDSGTWVLAGPLSASARQALR